MKFVVDINGKNTIKDGGSTALYAVSLLTLVTWLTWFTMLTVYTVIKVASVINKNMNLEALTQPITKVNYSK